VNGTLAFEPVDWVFTVKDWMCRDFSPLGLLGFFPLFTSQFDDFGDLLRFSDDVLRRIPLGFNNADEFAEFGTRLKGGLEKAGYGSVQAVFQGSSVTGEKYTTGAVFDVERVSDFDIALASPDFLQRAKQLGIGLRSGGIRTGPLRWPP
jgi:hypothetical protein